MDTTRNYEGDPTHGPHFVGPPGPFDNGVVQSDLEASVTVWYRMYPEIIRGVTRLDNVSLEMKPFDQSSGDQGGPDLVSWVKTATGGGVCPKYYRNTLS